MNQSFGDSMLKSKIKYFDQKLSFIVDPFGSIPPE